MKKYILKNSRKKFKMGDTVDVTVSVTTPFGVAKCVQKVVVNEQTLKLLISEGLVEVQENEIKSLFRKIARKLDVPLEEAEGFVAALHSVSSYAALQLLLEQASKKFNKGKNLKDCRLLYYVNVNGEIVGVQNRGHFNVPIFTTREDALESVNIVKDFYKSVYGEPKDS